MRLRVSITGLRIALGIVLPLLLVVSATLPFWLYHQRLPERLAVHWGLGGDPDGAMRLSLLLTLVLVLVVVPATVIAVLARRRRAQRGEIAAPMAIAGFIAALVAAMSWLTIATNLDVDHWREASRVGLLGIGAPVLLAAVLARSVSRLARGLESVAAPAHAAAAGLAPGAPTVWSGSARSVWALPLTLGSLLLAVIIAVRSPLAGLALGLPALIGLAFTSIRMTVDPRGVRILYGKLGWPRQRVKLAEIEQATSLHVRPMAWGGWGYRGSLRITGRAAIVLRGGEGVQLDLTGGRRMVITVDDAEAAARLINNLRAAQPGAL